MGSGPITDELGAVVRQHERRLAMAREIALTHIRSGGMCGCGRPLPCDRLAVLESLGASIEDAIGALIGPTQMIAAIDLDPVRPANDKFLWRWLRCLGITRQIATMPVLGKE